MYRPGGTRTPNPRFWRPVLYQLSYGPLDPPERIFSKKPTVCRGLSWPGAESNRRHHDFQSCALPTELPGPDKKPARAVSARAGSIRRRPVPTGSPLPPAFAGSTYRQLSRRPNSAFRPSFTVPERGKRRARRRFTSNSGGRIRTCDLRVMSPTSYQTAPPRNRLEKLVPTRRRGQPAWSLAVEVRGWPFGSMNRTMSCHAEQ